MAQAFDLEVVTPEGRLFEGRVRSAVTSTTASCSITPIWGAPRPMPGIAYMVSSMSIARTVTSSPVRTGVQTVDKTGSGQRRIGRTAT